MMAAEESKETTTESRRPQALKAFGFLIILLVACGLMYGLATRFSKGSSLASSEPLVCLVDEALDGDGYDCYPYDLKTGIESARAYDLDVPDNIINDNQARLDAGELYVSIPGATLGEDRVILPPFAQMEVIDVPVVLICRVNVVDVEFGDFLPGEEAEEYYECSPLDEDGVEIGLEYVIDLPEEFANEHQLVLEAGDLYVAIPGGYLSGDRVIIPSGSVLTVVNRPPMMTTHVDGPLICKVTVDDIEFTSVLDDVPDEFYDCSPVDEYGLISDLMYELELPETFKQDYQAELESGRMFVSVPGGQIDEAAAKVIVPNVDAVTVVDKPPLDAIMCHVIEGSLPFAGGKFYECIPIQESGEPGQTPYSLTLPDALVAQYQQDLDQQMLYVLIPGATVEFEEIVIPTGVAMFAVPAPRVTCLITEVDVEMDASTGEESYECDPVEEDGTVSDLGYEIELPDDFVTQNEVALLSGELYVSIVGGWLDSDNSEVGMPGHAQIHVIDQANP